MREQFNSPDEMHAYIVGKYEECDFSYHEIENISDGLKEWSDEMFGELQAQDFKNLDAIVNDFIREDYEDYLNNRE